MLNTEVQSGPGAGQVWERRDGSRFKIDHTDLKYVYYWLDSGSHPQYRSVARANLLRRYRLVQRQPSDGPIPEGQRA